MKIQSEKDQIFNLRKFVLYVPILIFTLLIISCNSASDNNNNTSAVSPNTIRSSEVQKASLDSVVRWLLDASAKDFNDHQPPIPIGFRNVQIRHLIAPNSEKMYIICGQFLAHDKEQKDKWIPFATVKTSGYEQWIGSQSLTYCQDSKVISYKIYDLSSALKSRVDSLRRLQELPK